MNDPIIITIGIIWVALSELLDLVEVEDIFMSSR